MKQPIVENVSTTANGTSRMINILFYVIPQVGYKVLNDRNERNTNRTTKDLFSPNHVSSK
jgi:hypothetical protein